MPWAEVNAPGDRAPVLWAAVAQAWVEVEGTASHIQGWSKSESAHEPLKLLGPLGLPPLELVIDPKSRHGCDSQGRNNDQ
jgi:hypothetical protein